VSKKYVTKRLHNTEFDRRLNLDKLKTLVNKIRARFSYFVDLYSCVDSVRLTPTQTWVNDVIFSGKRY